jgi:hypothetical protein
MVISCGTSDNRQEAVLLVTWAPDYAVHRGEVRSGGHSLTWDPSATSLARRVPTFGKEILALALHAAPASSVHGHEAVHVTLLWVTTCWSIVTLTGRLHTHPTHLTTEWALCGSPLWTYLPLIVGVPLWLATLGDDAAPGSDVVCRLASPSATHVGGCVVIVAVTSMLTQRSLLVGGCPVDRRWAVADLPPGTTPAHVSGPYRSPASVVAQRVAEANCSEGYDLLTLDIDMGSWSHRHLSGTAFALEHEHTSHRHDDVRSVVVKSPGGHKILRVDVSSGEVLLLGHVDRDVIGSAAYDDGTRSVVVMLSWCNDLLRMTTAEFPARRDATMSEARCHLRRYDNWPLHPIMASYRRGPSCTVVAAAHPHSAAASLRCVVVVAWD